MPFEKISTPNSKPAADRSLDEKAEKKKPNLRLVPPPAGETRNWRVPQQDPLIEGLKTTVPVLFERSLNPQKPDAFIAFTQLGHAHKYKLPEYEKMKERFVSFIDAQLAQPMDVLLDRYRIVLKNFRDNATDEKFDEGFEDTFVGHNMGAPGEASTNHRVAQRDETKELFEDAQFGITIQGFENAISAGDVFWAFNHLAKAKELLIPSFSDMIREFIDMIDEKLKQKDAIADLDYRGNLLRIKERALYNQFE